VTRKQYSTESVDFYNQSLEASTGISVDKDRWSDDDKEKEEEESININRIGTPDEQDSGENPNVLNFQQTSGSNNIVSNVFSTDFNNTPSDLLARTPTTYGQTLTKSGFKERAGVNFLGTEYFYAGVPTTLKGAGKAAKKGVFSLESLGKAAAKAVGLNSIVTGVALGFAKGKGVNDAFGNQSFRPDHAILGGVFDTVQSIQYADVAANQAALASYTGSGMSNQFSPTTGYDHVSGRATGFNGYVNGQLVTRRAGSSGYTGGFMDAEQMRAVEAISKGYIPTTFDINNESGERGVTVANNQGGMYDEKGNYHSLAGSAASGRMSDLEDLTETYFGKGQVNVSLQDNKFTSHKDVIGKSLQQARDQYHWWGGKKDPKNTKNLSVIIADNIRLSKGITTPAQAITNKMFEKTRPTRDVAEYYDDLGNKKIQDNIAEAQAISLADYKAMVAKQQKAGRYDDGSSDDGSQSVSDQASVADQQGGMFTAKGGFVSKGNNFALGGEAEPAGFIGGTPEQFDDQTTIADDIPLKVKDGTFVINAPAVEYAGSIDVQKMLAEGYEKAMTRDIGVDKNFRIGKIPSIEELDIQISRGEVVVPPHVAKVIGYDRLEKINNRGKREVERRQKAGNQEKVQAGQGFAAGGGEQKIKIFRGEPYPEQIGEFDKKYMSGRRMTGAWFSSNKNYAKNYGQLQKTLDVTFDEYAKGAKKAELYRNIAQMQSDSFSDKDYREKKGILNLTKKQRQQLFKHVKEIKQFAKMVQDGKADPKRFVNSLHMSIFPDKKEQATIRKIESYKNNPKLFAKLVVRGLANNIVNKGIPLASKAIPGIGALAGFSPKEMGDATLSGKEGFIYNYTPVKDEVTSFAEGGFAATGGEQNKLDPIKKYLSIADVKKQFKPFGSYKNAKAARVEIARLLKSLPEEDALALAMYSEADVLGEEGLEGVAHVVMNRMRAKDNKGNRYRNFGKDMYNTLLATYEGEGGERIFEFNGLEPSGFRKALKAFTNKEDKYMQVRNIAEDVFKGSRKDFTKNSLYYYNPYTTTSDWYKGQVKTGKFKEVHRTLNPDKKQTKSVHVYHTPIDDYFQELEVNVIPQETPTEKFKPLDDLPQPIRRPNPEPEPDRSGGGGFMFRGVGKNYETEGIISIN
jgi:hypothetical protein